MSRNPWKLSFGAGNRIGALRVGGRGWVVRGVVLIFIVNEAAACGTLNGTSTAEECPIDFGAVASLPARLAERVETPKKQEWERALGGQESAIPFIRARLSGWPVTTTLPGSDLPSEPEEFLRRVAADTWLGIAAMTDRQNGLPIDNVDLAPKSSPECGYRIGDYASGTNIGLYLISVAGAWKLGLIGSSEATERIDKALTTTLRLEHFRGLLFNFYDTVSLERTSNFVSFIDAAWFVAGLMVVRNAFPELANRCGEIIDGIDFSFFYNSKEGLISHGYYAHLGERSPFDYGMLYTEARLGALIAIGKGDVPDTVWFRMIRTYPAACTWQERALRQVEAKTIRGNSLTYGHYEWRGIPFVPSWGGSAFEALMPNLLLDESTYAKRSLGANDAAHAEVQMRFAREVLGYEVWGLSPAFNAADEGYGEFGVSVLGVRGYPAGVVSPHASALAVDFLPEASVANLRRLASLYPIYGEFGFYDAVAPETGSVARRYLLLDQAMTFVAIVNRLTNGGVRHYFSADPIVRAFLPILAEESFFSIHGKN